MSVGVCVGVSVGIGVRVGVLVEVGVCVGVAVGVDIGVFVGIGVGSIDAELAAKFLITALYAPAPPGVVFCHELCALEGPYWPLLTYAISPDPYVRSVHWAPLHIGLAI